MFDYAAAREAMVDRQVRTADVTRYPIIAAMLAVPREEFVPEPVRPVAYLGEHVPLAPGRVLLDPRVFAKLLEALARRTDRPRARRGLRPRLLDRGARPDGGGGGGGRGGPRHGSRGRAAARRACASTTPSCRRGRWPPASRRTGPSTRSSSRAAIEVLPQALVGQLKPGGRIAAIFVEGSRGQARLGLKPATASPGGVSSMQRRRCFRASLPRKRLSFDRSPE